MTRPVLVKKTASSVASILLYVFISICLLGVFMTVISQKDPDGAVTVLGKQARLVLTESMAKCDATDVSGFEIKDIPVGSMVFIETVPEDAAAAAAWYADLKVGDVLTFKYVYVRQETITHRITDIKEKTGGYLITLEGDNKGSGVDVSSQMIDTTKSNTPNYIIGKVTGKSLLLGLLVRLLKSTVGIVFVVIIPSLLIIVLEVLKIVRVFNLEKRTKQNSELEERRNEVEELKRRLAELQSAAQSGGADKADPPQ